MKKQKNPRAEFLTALMKNIGGDSGVAAISAFKDKNVDKFRHEMSGITDKLVGAMEQKVTKSFSEILQTSVYKSGVKGMHKGIHLHPNYEPVKIPRDGVMGSKRLSFEPIISHQEGVKGESLTSRAELHPARYADGKVLVKTPSGDGYKTRAGNLAEHVGGKYTNREKGYVMSPSAAEKFHALHENGYDANSFSKALQPPKSV